MGGDTYTAWNAGAMTTLSEELQKTHTAIVQEFDNLEQVCESKLAEWDGDARTAYTDAKRQWTAKQTEMDEIHQKFKTAVDNILQNYQSTEARNTSVMGG